MEKVVDYNDRKSSNTNLLNENIDPLHLSKLSGHKKVGSKDMTKVLSNVNTGSVLCTP